MPNGRWMLRNSPSGRPAGEFTRGAADSLANGVADEKQKRWGGQPAGEFTMCSTDSVGNGEATRTRAPKQNPENKTHKYLSNRSARFKTKHTNSTPERKTKSQLQHLQPKPEPQTKTRNPKTQSYITTQSAQVKAKSHTSKH
jgi:hypothetical protein